MVAQGGNGEPRSCRVCGARARAGHDDCYCCATVASQLGVPLVPVETLLEYSVGDYLHRLLRGYKDAPHPALRELRAEALARRVDEGLQRLDDSAAGVPGRLRLSGGEVVCVVPSSHRAGAPAEALVARVPRLASAHRRLLVRGPAPTGHLCARRLGFALSPEAARAELRGRRVLVFDDSLTTGARAQSAAFALRVAGCRVAGVLAVARSRRRDEGRRESWAAVRRPSGGEQWTS